MSTTETTPGATTAYLATLERATRDRERAETAEALLEALDAALPDEAERSVTPELVRALVALWNAWWIEGADVHVLDEAASQIEKLMQAVTDPRELLGRIFHEQGRLTVNAEREKPESSEEWRPVPGYEGLYEVSDLGQVRSLPRQGARGGLRTLTRDPEAGYLWLALWSGNKCAKRHAHQLVAAAFIGPCPPGLEVRHLDGNPANNRPYNLTYGTSSQNKLDQVRHGTHWHASKVHCKNGHDLAPENTYIDPAGRRCCRQCRAARDLARRADQLARRRAATAARRRERLEVHDRSA